MVYILETIQATLSEVLSPSRAVDISLVNDTGFFVVVSEQELAELQPILIVPLVDACTLASDHIDVTVLVEDAILKVIIQYDHNFSTTIQLDEPICYETPIGECVGRELQVGISINDVTLQQQCIELGHRFNFNAVTDPYSWQDKNSGVDIVLIDNCNTLKVDTQQHKRIIICDIDDPLIKNNHPGLLLWPFFDTDLLHLLCCFRKHTPLHVLVADDNKPSLMVTKVMLERIGCVVMPAEDGKQALEMAENKPFDIIFLDERMPNLLGNEVASLLKDGETTNKNTTKVSLTGLTEQTEIEQLYNAGVTDYLTKPVTRLVLDEFLAEWRKHNGVPKQ